MQQLSQLTESLGSRIPVPESSQGRINLSEADIARSVKQGKRWKGI